MEGQVKVLQALDQAVDKLRTWAQTTAKEQGATAEEQELLKQVLARDPIVFVPYIRDFLTLHGQALMTMPKEEAFTYFHALLPAAYARFKITEKILDKGRLFAQVFASLFNDLQ